MTPTEKKISRDIDRVVMKENLQTTKEWGGGREREERSE